MHDDIMFCPNMYNDINVGKSKIKVTQYQANDINYILINQQHNIKQRYKN